MSKRPDLIRAATLAAHITKAFPETVRPHLLARPVILAQRAALNRKAWETWRCNVDVPEEAENRRDKRDAAAVAKLAALFAEAGAPGVTVRLGGDPRGTCGWLKIPGQDGDGWDCDAGFPLY